MKLKNNKGVTLLILTITITVLLIITGITITNSKGQLAIKNVNNLYSDLESISTKVSDYYLKNDSLPVLENTYLNSSNALKLMKWNNSSTFQVYQDLYIINEVSHQIYYPKGVNYNGEIYFTKGNNAESINKIENISARFKQN